MKKTLLTLLTLGLIAGIGYYVLMTGPAREEIVFAGNYQSFESMSGSIDSEIITVLNFYAPRCPSCRAAHKTILSEVNQLPANLQILNVDYDSNQDLRMKYGVTSQHTFVLVDRNGNKIKSIQGLNHVSEIINFVGSDMLNPPLPDVMTGDILTGDIQSTGDVVSTDNKAQPQEVSAGIYTDYESGKKYISDKSKKVVLFFHASRCPSCRQAEADIMKNKNNIDSDVVILKVNYDDATDLKQKYEINSQTSYVLVHSDGSLNKKSVGLTALSEIETFVQ